jgi:hypothetical protein
VREDGTEVAISGSAVPAAEAGGSGAGRAMAVSVPNEGVPGTGDALPREVAEFLVAFAMGLHRFAMYPPGHPSLEPSAERMLTQLSGVLGTRSALTVGVTTSQLLVGGAASPEGHHVLSDLARRLHGHELGAIVIRAGLEMDELTDALRMLARDPVRGERPLGRLPARDRPSWTHLQVLPVEYDALELTAGEMSEGEALSVRELWLALFRSVFQGLEGSAEIEGLHAGGSLPTGLDMARGLRDHLAASEGGGSGSEHGVVAALHRLVAGLQWQGDGEGQDLRLRASELLRELDPDLTTRLLREGADPEGRRQLLVRTARAGLASDAVLRMLDAALAAEGREMSRPLLRLLAKLGAGTEAAPGAVRSEARSTLREQVEGIAAGWHEAGRLGRGGEPVWGRDPGSENGEELTRPTPIRLVELAVATNATGPALDAALEACVRRGNVERVLAITEDAPHDSRAATHIEKHLLSPEQLQALLSGDDVDEGSLRRIVDVLGEEAIEPLFDALATSDSRSVRRKIFDRLVAMGPRITPIVMTYLQSDAWFVRRNMLALLQRLPVMPPGFSPIAHLMDADLRVRREALPLAFRDPGSREHALQIALEDEDDRNTRLALLELQEGLPESVVPVLIRSVLEDDGRRPLRSLALRALGGSRSTRARDALEAACTAERGLLSRRRRLARTSPEVLAALHALGRGWRDDPGVAWVFDAATSSDDPRIRAAAGGA